MILRLFTLVCLIYSNSLFADLMLTPNTHIVFASVKQGKALLAQQDTFVKHLSPFDRAARMKTDKTMSTKQYLEFVQQHVQPWQQKNQQKVTLAFAAVTKALNDYSLNFPEKIIMIKTSGKEEGEAAYTRANAIVFGDKQLKFPALQLQKLLFHELFHVLSRNNPTLKDQLYQQIGFHPANNLDFPQSLKNRKITNPDAPLNDFFIRVKYQQQTLNVVPILFSRTDKYDLQKGGEFFSYLDFKLLVIEHNQTNRSMKAKLSPPQLLGVKQVSGFFEKIGRNTGYIIHPEEILAENFALLLSGSKNAKTPGLLIKIKHILEQ
ncbi:MAG: hypothetical protein ACI9FJ_000686 [Alteromonadaceae bacterium]|jgi:hypothetical protein